MKNLKKILLLSSLLVMMVFSSSCSKKMSKENTYVEGTDFQYTYYTQGKVPTIAESPKGYYFLSGYYLYYADKTTMKPVIMCNKPNCLHDEETNPEKIINCNAVILPCVNTSFLAYYDGYIYTITSIIKKDNEEYGFCKMSLDGTSRKILLKFDFPPKSLALHRGILYYSQNAYNEEKQSVYSIKSFNIEKYNSKPKVIYKGVLEGGSIQDLMCYGNNLYFKEFAHNEKIFATRNMRYDILTGKVNRMFTDNDKVFSRTPAIYDNKLYYTNSILNFDGSMKDDKDLVCDLDGSNVKDRFKTDSLTTFLNDGMYFYLDDVAWSKFSKPQDKRTLKILNKNGEAIETINTGNWSNDHSIIPGSKEHLFIESCDESMYKIFYMDKKEIGSGKVPLTKFFEIEKEKIFPPIKIIH